MKGLTYVVDGMPIYEGNEYIWESYKEKLEKEAELLVQPGRNPLLMMSDFFPEAVFELDASADTSHFYTAQYDRSVSLSVLTYLQRSARSRCKKRCAVVCAVFHPCLRLCSHPSVYLSGFPRLLENTGKSLIYFSKTSRTWKILENEIDPGKSWKLKCRVLKSPGL